MTQSNKRANKIANLELTRTENTENIRQTDIQNQKKWRSEV